MAYSLRQAFGKMSLQAIPRHLSHSNTLSFSHNIKGTPLSLSMSYTPVCTFATKEISCTKSAEKRHRQSEKRRMRNRSVKSAVGTRIKKVMKELTSMKGMTITDETQLKPVEKLISEAYKEIDKAVSKGVLHKNTGRRRKSKVGRARTRFMIASGLYVPEKPEPESLNEKYNAKNNT